MEMGWAYYDNMIFLPYLTTAILATWSLKSLFERWNEQPGWLQGLLRFAGENTMSVLAFHILAFKLVSYLIVVCNSLPIGRVAEFPVIDDYAKDGWWVAYLFVGSAVPLGIAYIQKKVGCYVVRHRCHPNR